MTQPNQHEDNLADSMKKIANEYAHKVAELEDSAVYAFLKGAVEGLELSGKDITKYALIRVENPMEMKDASLTIKSQYRIVPIETLTNIPIYED